ncbi:MAG: endolytic transglycosylase MltG [Lachnospiraceae bacterium]|nr:endolytic transglycosylase MltG [Lachnospiraceae bacterium]
MSIKEVIGSTAELIIKIALLLFAATYIIKASTAAYDYGYRIFTEEPVAIGEGRTISVSVEDPVSVMEVGEMLEERGLIRDAKLFLLQELLSENHGKLQPGIYDLSTAMTAEEMMDVMAADAPEEGEEDAEGESK